MTVRDRSDVAPSGPSNAPMQARIDPSYGWESHEHRGVQIHSIRGAQLANRLAGMMVSGASAETLGLELRSETGSFAGILAGANQVLAYVDSIHSFPVFYVDQPAGRFVGNSARQLVEAAGLREIDRDAVTEFLMAGYVTGAGTVYTHLKQLQAGELLLAAEGAAAAETHRYYRYTPNPGPSGDEGEHVAALGGVLDQVFRKLADRFRDAPIRVPLSGGLDSRLVLCKLKEFGCRDLQAFSYGPPNNYDAKIARRVASKIGVPWRFIPYRRAGQRNLFDSDERRRYWEYADQLSVSPSMREWEALMVLKNERALPADAILVNGQSGDFLSGGHVPKALWEPPGVNASDLIEAILGRHYALWTNLTTPERREMAGQSIREALGGFEANPTKQRIIALYEQWECQERQSKFVVNGQRMYEFLGCRNWQLPLWDRTLMDFWSVMPNSLKYDQKLYKQYLSRWDYGGVFAGPIPTVWRWPVHMMWVVPLARAAGLVNRNLKEEIYRYMWIFGHYSNYYAMYPLARVLRTRRRARSPISLFVDTWVRENGLAGHLPAELADNGNGVEDRRGL